MLNFETFENVLLSIVFCSSKTRRKLKQSIFKIEWKTERFFRLEDALQQKIDKINQWREFHQWYPPQKETEWGNDVIFIIWFFCNLTRNWVYGWDLFLMVHKYDRCCLYCLYRNLPLLSNKICDHLRKLME